MVDVVVGAVVAVAIVRCWSLLDEVVCDDEAMLFVVKGAGTAESFVGRSMCHNLVDGSRVPVKMSCCCSTWTMQMAFASRSAMQPASQSCLMERRE